jgi:hypothetical protein
MNSQTARNGFKTFIVTLSVSLLLFGVLYYLLSNTQSKADIESETAEAKTSANLQAYAGTEEAKKTSVFEDLTKTKPNVQPREVLAGATQATQSTTPSTGTTEITFAFMLSVIALSLGLFMFAKGPRKTALSMFERDFK